MTRFESYQFSFEEVCPQRSEINEFLRLDTLGAENPVEEFIAEQLLDLRKNEEIVGGYIIKELQSIHLKSGVITVENTELEIGKQVCGYLKGASHIALFLCTAGAYFSEASKRYNAQGEILEAYLVDALGSLTVESAMNIIQQRLEDSVMEKNLKISNRYSPGYCNWDLSSQQTLFRLIGNNPLPIVLSESCLMNPIKSVSGIIGIGKKIRKREYGCRVCNNKECIYRKLIA